MDIFDFVEFVEIVELNEEGLELFRVGLLSVIGLLPLICTLVVEFDKFDEIVDVTEVLGSNPCSWVSVFTEGVEFDKEFEDNFKEELVFWLEFKLVLLLVDVVVVPLVEVLGSNPVWEVLGSNPGWIFCCW